MITMTEDEYNDSVSYNEGWCTTCGSITEGVEPDAEYYQCGECDNDTVHGTEALFIMGGITIEGVSPEKKKKYPPLRLV